MQEKNKKNLLFVCGVVVGVFVLGLIVSQFRKPSDVASSPQKRFADRAPKYAQALINSNFLNEDKAPLSNSTSRGLASVSKSTKQVLEGQFGLDPWGNTMNYLVKKSDESNKAKLIIWSSGQDQKFQTGHNDVFKQMASNSGLKFTGDDFGHTTDFLLSER